MRTLISLAFVAPLFGGMTQSAMAASTPPIAAMRMHSEAFGRGLDRFGFSELVGGAERRAEQQMTIDTVGGGTIRGRVLVNGYSTTDSDLLEGAGAGAEFASRPASGIPVVLANVEGESHTVRTEADGSFAVEGLRSGTWEVRIAAADVPTFYQVSAPVSPVALTDGDETNVTIDIEPYVRFIRLVGDTPSR